MFHLKSIGFHLLLIICIHLNVIADSTNFQAVVESFSEAIETNEVNLQNKSENIIVHEDNYLRVTKNIITSGPVGETTHYEIHFEILNNIEILTIEERIPKTFTLIKTTPEFNSSNPLIWKFENLKEGDKKHIEIFIRPELEGTSNIDTLIQVEKSLNLTLFSGKPKIALTVKSPSELEKDETGKWLIKIQNVGTAYAKNIEVNALLSDGFMTESPTYFLLPNLDVNEIKTFDLDVTAVKKGIFENIFNAQFESSSDKDKYTTKTKTKVVKSEIKIETLTPVNAFVFKEADVKINIRNTGDTDLKNLNITQVLPDSFSIIDSSNGRIKDNAIGWLIPLLPAGNSQLITTKVSANLPGASTINTYISNKKGLYDSAQSTTKWLSVPGITISMSDNKDPLKIGEITNLTIKLLNQGEFDPVEGKIELTFSEHIKPKAILSDIDALIEKNKILIPAMELNPDRDITIKVQIEAIKPGSGRTNLSFIADFLSEPLINQESTNIY